MNLKLILQLLSRHAQQFHILTISLAYSNAHMIGLALLVTMNNPACHSKGKSARSFSFRRISRFGHLLSDVHVGLFPINRCHEINIDLLDIMVLLLATLFFSLPDLL